MSKKGWLAVLFCLTACAARAGVFWSGVHFADKPGEWWSMKSAAMYGGWVGGGLGGLAGILGATAGLMVSRGKGKRFIMGAMTALTIAGLISLAAGIAALVSSQPYHVTYPLLLTGIILFTVCGSNTWMLKRMYIQVEMRQMAARDA